MLSITVSAASQANPAAREAFERAVAAARRAPPGPQYDAAIDKAERAFAWLVVVNARTLCAGIEAAS